MIRWLHAVPCLLISGLTGCATIVHGTTQVVPIVSTPSGARVAIDSVPVGNTPLRAVLSRARSHVVTVSRDSSPPVNVELNRSLSGWVWGNLFTYYLPALIDLANGAAFKFDIDTVRVVFPGQVAADDTPTCGFGGDRIRFVTSMSEQSFVYARLDSSTADHLYLHRLLHPQSQGCDSVSVVPRADVRRLDLAVGTRWAPWEVDRTGSPLLVDDWLRIQLAGSERPISGRLVAIDRSDIFMTVGQDTTGLRRSMVASMQRPDGYDWAAGARRGLAIGAIVGALIGAPVHGSAVHPNGPNLMLGAGIGSVIGLLGTTALAPRKWVQVLRW